jgi:hypothetical protein
MGTLLGTFIIVLVAWTEFRYKFGVRSYCTFMAQSAKERSYYMFVAQSAKERSDRTFLAQGAKVSYRNLKKDHIVRVCVFCVLRT